MNLSELCEPFFQHMCRLNRSARTGATPELTHARAELQELLASLRSKAAASPDLKASFDRVEIVLVYFADWLIRTSKLPFATSWSDLALERGKPGGDEDFFDELDKTLKETTPDALDRLTIFYTCLGLGFTGWYAGQPEFLRKKMTEVHARVRSRVDSGAAERVTPEAYEHVNTADLVEPPSTRVVGLVIVLTGLAVTVLAANAALYLERRGELRDTLQQIIDVGGGGASGSTDSTARTGGSR
jgi:hypothetical protein